MVSYKELKRESKARRTTNTKCAHFNICDNDVEGVTTSANDEVIWVDDSLHDDDVKAIVNSPNYVNTEVVGIKPGHWWRHNLVDDQCKITTVNDENLGQDNYDKETLSISDLSGLSKEELVQYGRSVGLQIPSLPEFESKPNNSAWDDWATFYYDNNMEYCESDLIQCILESIEVRRWAP